MARPSARAASVPHIGISQPAMMRKLAAERRAESAARDEAVVATVKKLGCAYSVEVAEALHRPNVNSVASALARLKRQGRLASEFRDGPHKDGRHASGQGRRYYRIAGSGSF
jgi:hypothetical protein